MSKSCPSAILNSLTPSEKKSLAGLVAVSLPADDLADGQWSITLLEDILVFLDLDRDLAEGFYPITERGRRHFPRPADLRAAWEERVDPFRACLPPMGEPRAIVLRDLMVVVALRCGYDARTRVTFRRVCDAMQVPWHPRVSEVESTLARKVYERVTRERERELRGDRWRGVKIGAAMIGGGTLLAISGGLAAPALAAGLAASSSVIGASAAATLSGFATTAWMATVFGATGAGLVGYKMDRRTKGVKEFEFESETSVGEEMCVSICISGVLKDKADLQRAWGVEPRGSDVSAKERLRRFYYVFNRDKVGDVEDILKAYKGRESKLCRALVARYGVDPRDPLGREDLARAEGRRMEGVSQEDLGRDAEAIEQLMESVLAVEKKEKEKTKVMAKAAAKMSGNSKKRHDKAAHATAQPPPPRLHGRGEDARNPPPVPAHPSYMERFAKASGASGNASRPSVSENRPTGADASAKIPAAGAPVETPIATPVGPPDASSVVAGSRGRGSGILSPSSASLVGREGYGSGTVAAPASDAHDDGAARGGGGLLRDWDRNADGRVQTLRHGVAGLGLSLAGVKTKVSAAKIFAVGGGGKSGAAAGGGSGVARAGQVGSNQPAGGGGKVEEIELFVEEGADEAFEKDEKETEDTLKYRVWFWQDELPHTDQYVLRWESDLQIALGKSVSTMIKSISNSAIQETLKYTTLAAIMASLTWPLALITLSSMIDADWTIGRERADIAGKILADALLNREQGCRPVTLVGTSLGARLIFACLEEIARRHELWEEQTQVGAGQDGDAGASSAQQRRDKVRRLKNAVTPNNNGKSKAGLNGVGLAGKSGSRGAGGGNDAKNAAGVIENVCLLGSPVGASAARWERVARIVHGRIINGYSRSDIILGLVFRAKSLSLSVAGVQKVAALGVENVDLSAIVGTDHFNYNRRMPEILPLLALDDCSKYVGKGDRIISDSATSTRRPAEGSSLASSSTSRATGDVIVYGTTVVP